MSPQTLKLISYIKHQKVIVLIENNNNHNFIHRRVAKETRCCARHIPNFQIMIANGDMMRCGGRCENVKLQMGEYSLKTHMFSVEMGGCDVVLEV
jgi:ribosomal protein S17